MPNKNYQRGRRFEWEVKKDLEKQGYAVMRTAGSHGAYDLIAIYDGTSLYVRFIQCKVVKKLTDGVKKTLLKELKTSSPVTKAYCSDYSDITVELFVKETGTKDYRTFYMEP